MCFWCFLCKVIKNQGFFSYSRYKELWNFFELMLCILIYLFFKKSLLGWLVVNNVFKPKVALGNLVFQNAIRYFFFRNIYFTSRFAANILTFIPGRIARVLKTSATQAVVLDISNLFYRVLHTGLLYKLKLYGIMKRCFILLSHFVVLKDFELLWSTSHLLMHY